MATSKEKKRYHLTATSDGWSESGSAGLEGEGRTSRSASLQKGLKPPAPPRRRP